MNDLVSIVIPAYNVEKFIIECLKSVQQQTYKNWQTIIVDDGSSDKTAEVIQPLIQRDNRFQLIQQTNGGVSKARNAGIKAATGTHLAFLDGDDMWQPNFLAALMDAIQSSHSDMAYCGYTHQYASGMRRKFSYPYSNGNILLDVVQGKTQIHIGAILVRKKLIDQTGLLFTEGCRVGQDQEFIWKLVSHAKVQDVHQELMIYRIREKSAVTSKWKWQNHIHAIYGFKRAAKYVSQHALQVYDRQQLSKTLNERIAYKVYKFIWRMIKNGYQEEARQLINNKEYSGYLSYLDPGKMKVIDRLKYKIINAKSGLWWNLARLF